MMKHHYDQQMFAFV